MFFAYKIKSILPNGNVFFIINTELKQEVFDGIKTACEFYNVKSIVLEEIDKTADHPTVKGMEQIKNQVLNIINE